MSQAVSPAVADFTLHSRETAPEGSHGVMDAYKSRFGFVPNLIKILSASPAATKGYADTYALLAQSDFTPAEQQLLFLTISRAHECTYCVAAHTMAGKMAHLDEDIIKAVREGRPILDPKLAALSTFALKLVETRGQVSRDDTNNFLTAGYSEAQILDVLLAIATKTISNYLNHIAETPLDDGFATEAWSPSVLAAE